MATPDMLYVGTDDGLALYHAASGGAWREVRRMLAGGAVQVIVAANALTLLVAVAGGPAQQSLDGGVTWSAATGPPPAPIGLQVATRHGPQPLANPRLRGATAYASLAGRPPTLLGAGAGGMLLFRSEDDGIHWEPAQLTDPAGLVTCIIPATDRAGSAWAGTDAGALLRSNDRGRTWRTVARAPAPIRCLAAVARA